MFQTNSNNLTHCLMMPQGKALFMSCRSLLSINGIICFIQDTSAFLTFIIILLFAIEARMNKQPKELVGYRRLMNDWHSEALDFSFNVYVHHRQNAIITGFVSIQRTYICTHKPMPKALIFKFHIQYH